MSLRQRKAARRAVRIANFSGTKTLILSGPLAFAAGAPSGTPVANIGGVPDGVTPTLTPNDGRLLIAGDATNGWKVVVGLAAASAGAIAITVNAMGAKSASASVSVAAASRFFGSTSTLWGTTAPTFGATA